MALGDTYVSADTLKTYLRVTHATDDARLASVTAAVSRWIEGYCQRQFNLAAGATAKTYRPAEYSSCEIDDLANVTDLAVAVDQGDDGTFEETWTLSTDFILEPVNATSAFPEAEPFTSLTAVGAKSFPVPYRLSAISRARSRPSLRVTGRWGWPAVPAAVTEACLIQSGRVHKRRDSPEGVLAGAGEFGPVRVGTRLDPDVRMMLDPYRRDPFAIA